MPNSADVSISRKNLAPRGHFAVDYAVQVRQSSKEETEWP